MGRESGVEGRRDCAVEHGRRHRERLSQESIVETALRKLGMEFCSALRRREIEHAETRGRCELEKLVSCGSGEQRWRAKLDLTITSASGTTGLGIRECAVGLSDPAGG